MSRWTSSIAADGKFNLSVAGMETRDCTMPSPTDIRKGRVMIYQNVPHLVTDVQHRTQGRQAGFVQVTMRNLNTGASTNTKIRTTDSVEFCFMERKKLEYSYRDGDGYHFINSETFDDTLLPVSILMEKEEFLVENTSYDIMFVNEKPVGLDLPAAIEMEVIESAEGIRGDTASNVQKPAKLETGLIVQVPLFIKSGDRIRVSTENATYLGKA
ncbi:MAG: elongation factor P [Puniceicoccales bacterium]|nr:elongation factor P [Puniceicoccales bacterium]